MIVLQGTVRISRTTSTGKEVILADVPEGDIFGEIAVLDGGGRSADATALTNVELLVIDRREVLAFLADHSDACLRLLARTCNLLRRSDDRMSDVAFADVGLRLAKTIFRQIALPEASRRKLRVSLSQGELAKMVASSRESVNKQIAKWQREGIVDVRNGWIVVADYEALSTIASGLVT